MWVNKLGLVMWRYFCNGFNDFMLNNKRLTNFTNFFSLHSFKKNDEIILKHFQ